MIKQRSFVSDELADATFNFNNWLKTNQDIIILSHTYFERNIPDNRPVRTISLIYNDNMPNKTH